jgi:preprotein translocase subunit SecY
MSELAKRLGVSLAALVIYRLGTRIPLPGVDLLALQQIYDRTPGGVLGGVDWGGWFGHLSIFTLGIGPYLAASFGISVVAAGWRRFRGPTLERDGQRKKLDRFARLVAVVLAASQAYAIALILEGAAAGGHSLVLDPGPLFRLGTVVTLTGGSVLLVWVADQITRRGLGNGLGLILFAGIVARMRQGLASMLELVRTGALSVAAVLLVLGIAVGTVALIVLMETAERRFVVQYRPRLVHDRMFEGEGAYLRLKLNNAGIVPVGFAASLLLFAELRAYVLHGTLGYVFFYTAVTVGLCFIYTAIMLSPTEMAARLQAYGGFVAGYEPGEATAAHLRYVLRRLTLVGGAYLALICALPDALVPPHVFPSYFGGSMLLIVVAVVLDTVVQLRAQLLQYR